MVRYICLKQQEFSYGNYRLVPLRYEDRFLIMKWRNEQIYHLRQSSLLTEEDQQRYFDNVVAKIPTLHGYHLITHGFDVSELRKLLQQEGLMFAEDEMKENGTIFKKLYEASRLSNLNEEEMREYKKSVLEYQDVQDAIKYASRRNFEEGEKRGEKRGAADARRMIIMQMLANDISIPMISKLTGLSEEEVNELKVEN